MRNKYYLLEQGNKDDALFREYASFKGSKAQLESQLNGQPALFDSGSINLVNQKFEKRKGHKYLHMLVNGKDEELAEFESYLDAKKISLVGARLTESDCLDSLVYSYIPRTEKSALRKSGEKAFEISTRPFKAIDSLVSEPIYWGFGLAVGLGSVVPATAVLGRYLNEGMQGNHLDLLKVGAAISTCILASSVYGVTRWNKKQ